MIELTGAIDELGGLKPALQYLINVGFYKSGLPEMRQTGFPLSRE